MPRPGGPARKSKRAQFHLQNSTPEEQQIWKQAKTDAFKAKHDACREARTATKQGEKGQQRSREEKKTEQWQRSHFSRKKYANADRVEKGKKGCRRCVREVQGGVGGV